MSPRAHTETGLGFEGAKRLLGALRDPDPAALPPPPHASGDPSAPAGAAGFPSIPAYRFVARLGSGGSGTVFKVFRDGSDRPLALKLLAHASAGPADSAQRAFRELDFLETLRLPCVPRLIDYGTHEGRLFFVTDLVPGTSLADLPPPDSSDLRTRVELLARVADAVALLHDRAVLHRDLKPSNVIADPSGQPVIIDLGLAHALNSGLASLTQTGVPLGTPAFMSPEAARGDHRLLSIRTDVFGLGAIGYWLLTGQPPHSPDASVHGAIRRAAEQPVRNPLEAAPTLPIPLSLVLQKACAVRIEHRYATAADFAADLRRYLRGERVLAQPPSLWQHALRWVARHPLATTSAACALVVALSLAIGLLSAWWMTLRPAYFTFDTVDPRDATQATLVTATGYPLARVGGGFGTYVRIAEMVPWPAPWRAEHNLKHVAVLVAGRPGAADSTEGALWVCDPADLRRPLYADSECVAPSPPALYADLFVNERTAGRLPVQAAILADVFAGEAHPGPEIVAIHTAGSTPCAVRVYSLRCELLFEAWHFGPLFEVAWFGEADTNGLIVLTGDRHGRLTHTWDRLGVRKPGKQYANVVLALRPVMGKREGWLADADQAGPASALAWYKAVWPAQASDWFSLPRLLPYTTWHVAGVLPLVFATQLTGGSHGGPPPPRVPWEGTFSLGIDAQGRLVESSLHCSDEWERTFGGDRAAARDFARSIDLVDFPRGVPAAAE